MRPWVLVLRWAALVSLAVWFGGFTFYSAFVIPVLEEVLGKRDAGSLVTREVTVTLNRLGVTTLAVWWLLLAVERRLGGLWPRRARATVLLVNTGLLAVLFPMHQTLGRMLDEGTTRGFYRLHENYLIVSTAQWVALQALLVLSLWLWRADPQPEPGEG